MRIKKVFSLTLNAVPPSSFITTQPFFSVRFARASLCSRSTRSIMQLAAAKPKLAVTITEEP